MWERQFLLVIVGQRHAMAIAGGERSRTASMDETLKWMKGTRRRRGSDGLTQRVAAP
jgi:hypothetical protein